MKDGEPLRVTLPGTIYQRGTRWWWHGKLPGEDKAKSRPLKAKGARAATPDRATAESIAFEMWEQAVRERAITQVSAESSQKIAALKAQFLERVNHFTRVVEEATAQAEAEARARAEAEARLRETAQVEGAPTKDAERSVAVVLSPANPPPTTGAHVSADIDREPRETTGACECCDAEEVPVSKLRRIDSGQWLCPRCLAALWADVARLPP
jgi:hypothetical protein